MTELLFSHNLFSLKTNFCVIFLFYQFVSRTHPWKCYNEPSRVYISTVNHSTVTRSCESLTHFFLFNLRISHLKTRLIRCVITCNICKYTREYPMYFTGARGTDLPPPFLFTNLFSIKFLYFFIISSLFPYFNLFVSIFIQSYVNIKLHVSTLSGLKII